MKNIVLIFIFFIGFSCTNTTVLPATSSDIMNEINSFKGEKVVILNVWALWCVPCVEEFPMIVELNESNEDLEVIFVSADFEDELQQVKNFLEKQGVSPYSYIKKEKDELFIEGINKSWTGSLPFTVVFSKNKGIIVDSWEGKEPKSRFEVAIDIALNSSRSEDALFNNIINIFIIYIRGRIKNWFLDAKNRVRINRYRRKINKFKFCKRI